MVQKMFVKDKLRIMAISNFLVKKQSMMLLMLRLFQLGVMNIPSVDGSSGVPLKIKMFGIQSSDFLQIRSHHKIQPWEIEIWLFSSEVKWSVAPSNSQPTLTLNSREKEIPTFGRHSHMMIN